MNPFRKTRHDAGLTIQKTSDITLVPFRTIQEWELGNRHPPEYVKRWYLKELKEIKDKGPPD